METAFEEVGLVFHKTRPAGLFFRKMATEPTNMMTPESTKRFEALFGLINERLQKSVGRAAEPFH
jgi:hypothetical protein